MVILVGDIHGEIEINKLSNTNWPEQKELTSEDTLIILGDFGLFWHYERTRSEQYWLDWLIDKPYQVTFIDGNHENHDLLDRFETDIWNGDKVGIAYEKENKKILHLKRGSVFEIDKKTFFCFGGAESHDKERRTYGQSIWRQEVPSYKEMDYAFSNLEEKTYSSWCVDYILTHTAPNFIVDKMKIASYGNDPTRAFLDEVHRRCYYEKWFAGHFHRDQKFYKFELLYNNKIKVCQ